MIDQKVIAQVIEKYINTPPNEQVIAAFAQDLYDQFDLAFHFDEDFSNYCENDTQQDIFTQPEAEALDLILNRMWDYCTKKGIDIHEIAGKVQQAEFKKRGILPQDAGTDLEEDMSVRLDGSLNAPDFESAYPEDTENDAYEKGKECGYKGIPAENCPYEDYELVVAWKTGWEEATQAKLTEDINLTEDNSDAYDQMRANIKPGWQYYDNYKQVIFTVDQITNDGFVCCTDINDPTNKWNEDLVSFNRHLKMEAYDIMKQAPVQQEEPALMEEEEFNMPSITQIAELGGEQLRKVMSHMSREDKIAWLQWNDRHGQYSDEERWREDESRPLSDVEVDEMMYRQITDNNGLDEGFEMASSGYQAQGPIGSSNLLERSKPIGNEAEIDKVYTINGRNIKVVGIEAGLVRYRVESQGEIPAQTPKSISLEKFNEILQSGKMKAI